MMNFARKKQTNFNHVNCRKKCDLWGCQITKNDVNTQAIEKYWGKKGNLGEHFGLDITFGWVPCLADFITIAL